MMKNRMSSSVFLVVFAGLFASQLCSVYCAKNHRSVNNNYITWKHMRVNTNLELNDRNNTIIVAKDGSGHSETVQGAVNMIPDHNTQRVKILIYPGVYRERVHVPRTKPYISFIGTQSNQTIITYNAKASDKDAYGNELGTFKTATVEVASDYFTATEITIENSIDARSGGRRMQAVALKVSGDKAIFYRVKLLGSQDTLLDLRGRHYFYQCFIQGYADFICGNAKSLYEDCTLNSIARKFGAIAAHRRNSTREDTGFSFVNCRVTGTGRNFLGRAWGPYARIIYSHCRFDNIIDPSRWNDWKQPSRRKTVSFGEYQCRGRGANTRKRVEWAKQFSYEEVKSFTNKGYINGDQWLRL